MDVAGRDTPGTHHLPGRPPHQPPPRLRWFPDRRWGQLPACSRCLSYRWHSPVVAALEALTRDVAAAAVRAAVIDHHENGHTW